MKVIVLRIEVIDPIGKFLKKFIFFYKVFNIIWMMEYKCQKLLLVIK